ncbi:MAG: alpha/beta-hydrolase N-terminal domain-containing protein, partial [Terracoccus sp.]
MSVTVSSPDAPEAVPDAGSTPPSGGGPSWWRPRLGEPNRVFQLSFSGVGVTVAAWFFSLSLQPSLLPRDAVIQGVTSGVTVLIGYGAGAGAQALWEYLGIPVVAGRWRAVLGPLLVTLGVLAAVFSGWRFVGWQNEIRNLYGMEPTSPTIWPVVIVVALSIATLLLVVGRALRLFGQLTVARLARRLPPRLAIVLGAGLLMALFWGLWTGVIVQGFFAGANAIFAPQDTNGSQSTNRPTVPERSGSPQSLAAWEDLGYYGRLFVRGGPTAERLAAVNGPGAKAPIRVYAGLQN